MSATDIASSLTARSPRCAVVPLTSATHREADVGDVGGPATAVLTALAVGESIWPNQSVGHARDVKIADCLTECRSGCHIHVLARGQNLEDLVVLGVADGGSAVGWACAARLAKIISWRPIAEVMLRCWRSASSSICPKVLTASLTTCQSQMSSSSTLGTVLLLSRTAALLACREAG